jgi:hypothetical protein
MKKLLFLLLGLAVATTASAGVNGTPIQKKVADYKGVTKGVMASRANGLIAPSTSISFHGWNKQVSHVLRSDQAITWGFETEDEFNEWMAVDNDGDGFNWQYFNNEGLTQGLMTAHDGYGLVASASYDNDSQTALNPDNYLVSPQVTLGGALTLWACGQDATYCAEKFGIYVCIGTPAGPEDFVQVGPDMTTTGTMTEYSFDLSAYQGQVGCFAIVHHNVSDMFWLNIDDVTLDVGAVVLPYPIVANLTVNPAATTADVAWEGTDAEAYNLRYRPYTPGAENAHFWSLPVASYQQELTGWQIYDADGDGNNWGVEYSSSAQDDVCFYSESWSYSGGGALTPDNWLFTPEVNLEGILRFTMWGSSSYPDNLMVYAVVGDTQYQLFEEDLIAQSEHQTYEVDLSQFEGALGQIAFRHYNCTDMMEVCIDDIFIGNEVELAEWIYVNDITDPNYTITGLTPETTYEVQVMGYNASHETDWTEIVQFTTLADTPAFLRGDVDNNGEVKIGDVTALISYLLSGDPTGINVLAADCDQNGEVKIGDVTALIAYLLSGTW